VTIFDAPDGQNAVVNAQLLLASVAANTASVTVALNPNITTVAVFGGSAAIPYTDFLECLGVTTGNRYPGSTRFTGGLGIAANVSRFFTVSPALDSEVTIEWVSAPTAPWFVVGMTGVNMVDVPALAASLGANGGTTPGLGLLVMGTDGTDARPLATDVNGRQIPLVPTKSSGVISATTGGVTVLAAPSSGENYLFGVDVQGVTAADVLTLSSVAKGEFAFLTAPLTTIATLDLKGFAVSDAVTATTSVDTANVVLRYASGP
jgi:hypothetical protein